MKRCRNCGRELPVSLSGRRAGAPDGLARWCKPCTNTVRRAAYRAAHPLPPPVPEGFTRCTRCRQVKPVSEYARDKYIGSGLKSWCRRCTKSYRLQTARR